jgi:plastocyanin
MRRRLTWVELVRVVAAVQAVLLALAAFALSDVEAVAFAVITTAVVLLTYWRKGLVATIVLGLVFADVLFWMAPGAISNLRHHERLFASVGPAVLAAVAACGLVAVARRALSGRVPPTGDARPAALVMIGVIVAVVAVSYLSGSKAHGDRAQPGDARVVMHGVKFSPSTITASAVAGVEVTNHDLFWHTFTVKGRDLDVRVPVGGHRRQSLSGLAPGRYTYYCRIPGHESAGMTGTLIVTG